MIHNKNKISVKGNVMKTEEIKEKPKEAQRKKKEKPSMERLIKEIEDMGHTHGLNEVFVTFLELSATSLGAHLDPVNGMRFVVYAEIDHGAKGTGHFLYRRFQQVSADCV